MKNLCASLFSVLAATLLGSSCVAPAGKSSKVLWSTIPPDSIEPTEHVLAAGPFHLYHQPSLALVNFDEHYDGDDTPWIDKTDDFRDKVAECMQGYAPGSITLADVAVARWGFLRERLGDDFVWKDYGRDDRELAFIAGTKWESINKYADIRDSMYPGVFRRASDSSRGRMLSIRVVYDYYRALPGKQAPVRDVTVFLHGLEGGKPIPKTSFTVMDEEIVRQIGVEGTEHAVPGGYAVDVQTPRGRFTVYRPDDLLANRNWASRYLPKQEVWYVGKALMGLLNSLPEETLERIPFSEE